MNWWYVQSYYNWPYPYGWFFPFVLLEIVLKSVALWRSARNNQIYWFIGLTMFPTFGLLPIVYLLFFQKKRKENKYGL